MYIPLFNLVIIIHNSLAKFQFVRSIMSMILFDIDREEKLDKYSKYVFQKTFIFLFHDCVWRRDLLSMNMNILFHKIC